MDKMTLYKTWVDVTFAEVVSEIKWRYPDLNMKTASIEYMNLMVTVSRHAKTNEGRLKFVAKILLASLISDCFTTSRMN